ncbi:hypothetical protein CBR_g50280 [Chara braunii]|uniref:Uncharacterized protein n=1 Tax=Chara braunii TaxID=69332 RepID=A0A388M6N1_CHABU|nr:hypothetical protein CBR_g50280 [Chara braunii]|eukprot:GBG90186.1 hypothetical protein CBR_g50280 [Chara braunii]
MVGFLLFLSDPSVVGCGCASYPAVAGLAAVLAVVVAVLVAVVVVVVVHKLSLSAFVEVVIRTEVLAMVASARWW